ncbi:MAG: hypothetical protein ACREDP_16685 [Bradyrhizobium sp.]
MQFTRPIGANTDVKVTMIPAVVVSLTVAMMPAAVMLQLGHLGLPRYRGRRQ